MRDFQRFLMALRCYFCMSVKRQRANKKSAATLVGATVFAFCATVLAPLRQAKLRQKGAQDGARGSP